MRVFTYRYEYVCVYLCTYKKVMLVCVGAKERVCKHGLKKNKVDHV